MTTTTRQSAADILQAVRDRADELRILLLADTDDAFPPAVLQRCLADLSRVHGDLERVADDVVMCGPPVGSC